MAYESYKHFVDIFEANVHYLAEQTESYLVRTCETTDVKGRQKWIDRAGAIEDKQVTSQYQPKTLGQAPRSRISLETNVFTVNQIINDNDVERSLTDPKSIEASRASAALNRRKDKEIVAAAFADVKEETGGILTFAADGGHTIAAGGSGITKAKLDESLQVFLENDAILDKPLQKYLIVSPAGLISLTQETEFKNRDYITEAVMRLQAGQAGMLPIHGFNVIVSNLLDIDGSDIRDCIAFTENAFTVGYTWDKKITVNPRHDLELDPIGIDGSIAVGAVRKEGTLVHKIQIDES